MIKDKDWRRWLTSIRNTKSDEACSEREDFGELDSQVVLARFPASAYLKPPYVSRSNNFGLATFECYINTFESKQIYFFQKNGEK